ncbi:hypothetical protein [Bradyrhizobium sp.]|uniref:hypothetical protein n=1 Tax=Bradyrhizobium sp. TaxID=376 RepID=UPI003C703D65
MDQLEQPICPNCRLEMKWFRSTLQSADPIEISHLFSCPNCKRTAETKSTMRAVSIPPEKLSAPFVRRAA